MGQADVFKVRVWNLDLAVGGGRAIVPLGNNWDGGADGANGGAGGVLGSLGETACQIPVWWMLYLPNLGSLICPARQNVPPLAPTPLDRIGLF